MNFELVVGIPMLPVGYAFCMIINGILQFTFINISGRILSVDPEAYTELYYFYGITLVFGGSLWFIPFFAGKCHQIKHRLLIHRHSKNLQQQQQQALPEFVETLDASSKPVKTDTIPEKRTLNAAGMSNISLF